MEIKRYLKNYIKQKETLEANIQSLDKNKEKYKITNLIFNEKELYPYVFVSKEAITSSSGLLPLTSREGEDRVIINKGYELANFEPLPFKMEYTITAKHVNNIKTMSNIEWGLEKLIDDAQQKFIEKIREGIEILGIQALSGKLNYPLNKGGTYDLEYSRTVIYEENLKNISLEKLQEILLKTRSEMSSSADTYFLITDEIYNSIFASLMNKNIGFFPTDVGLNFAGMNLVPISRHRKGIEILNEELIIAVDAKAGHKLLYCAIDSFEAGLQATPLYTEIEEISGKLIITGQSKPFLIVNPDACRVIKDKTKGSK